MLPSPLMDTREEGKGLVPVSNGSSKQPVFGNVSELNSDGGKASRMRLAVDQPRQQQLQRLQPPRPSPPQMSPHEAHSIVQRMSSDLMMSYAHTSASLAACMQVPNPRHYAHVTTSLPRDATWHWRTSPIPSPPPLAAPPHTPL